MSEEISSSCLQGYGHGWMVIKANYPGLGNYLERERERERECVCTVSVHTPVGKVLSDP